MNFRVSLRTVVDVFAILTGLSFVLSALVQEAIFAFWKLDFTSVATVEDVVMGGIRLLSFALLWAAIIVFSGYSVFATAGSGLAPPSGSWARRIRNAAIVAVGALLIVGYVPRISQSTGTAVTIGISVMLAFYGVFVTAINFFTSPYGISSHYQAVKNFKLTMTLIAPLAIGGAIFQSFFWYKEPTSQIVSFIDGSPWKCRNNIAKEPVIQWIGSRALVLSCSHRKQVVLLGENSYILKRR